MTISLSIFRGEHEKSHSFVYFSTNKKGELNHKRKTRNQDKRFMTIEKLLKSVNK